jgi:hypothetical protein
MNIIKTAKSALAVAALLVAQNNSSALVLTFENVTTVANDYAPQLSVDIFDLGAGSLQFKFMNNGSVAGRIAGISFQDLDGLLSSQTLVEPAGVNFKWGGGANIPNSMSFTEVAAFELTKDGAAVNGIDPGQWLGVKFLGDFDDVIAAVNDGKIGIGLHVISIMPGGGSQKFVNEVPPSSTTNVPDGGPTFMLLGVAIISLCALRYSLKGRNV